LSGGVSNIRGAKQHYISQRLTARRNNLSRSRLPSGGFSSRRSIETASG